MEAQPAMGHDCSTSKSRFLQPECSRPKILQDLQVHEMKDALLLLLTGIACSLAAWAFWHYLGNNAFGVLNSLLVTVLAVDNFQLRRQLRERSK